jgi:hypothetical protein
MKNICAQATRNPSHPSRYFLIFKPDRYAVKRDVGWGKKRICEINALQMGDVGVHWKKLKQHRQTEKASNNC